MSQAMQMQNGAPNVMPRLVRGTYDGTSTAHESKAACTPAASEKDRP
jgi:hypothetical protein